MNDPYLDNILTENRLYNEYQKYGKIIVAVDFDDTCYDYHKAGHTYERVLNLLLDCQKLGFYICVFTGTAKDKWNTIYEYMEKQGLKILKN
jgi:hypothetical protein